MTEGSDSDSERAKARARAKKRREVSAALRQTSFDALAAGWSVEQIAEVRKVSPRTIRREVDRVVQGRRLDAPDRYIHLQVQRLTKALRVADLRLDRGELAAVAPMAKVVAALDRYHGLEDRVQFAAVATVTASLAAPAAPLALTRAAPPLIEAVAATAKSDSFGRLTPCETLVGARAADAAGGLSAAPPAAERD